MPKLRRATRAFRSVCFIGLLIFASVGSALADDVRSLESEDCYLRPGMLSLRVISAQHDGAAVVGAEWLVQQLEWARRLFAPLSTTFCVKEVIVSSQVPNDVETRAMRSELRKFLFGNEIHIFLTGRLADVDQPGAEIRGVHWRVRRNNQQKQYIILSSSAPSFVLAHELGHYLGLPHSRFKESIMNKSERKVPPLSLRTFAKPEYNRLRRGLKRLYRRRLRTKTSTHSEGQ